MSSCFTYIYATVIGKVDQLSLSYTEMKSQNILSKGDIKMN